MEALFTSGRIVYAVLGFLVLELGAVSLWYARGGSDLSPSDIAGDLLAGACLALALMSALMGADWRVTALLLTSSLPAHLWDLRRRWQVARRRPNA